MLHRSDVRANSHGGGHQAGVPLRLTINVVDSNKGCKPLDGVAVDIWHANAHGLYSDESSQQAGGGTTSGDTISDNWLRGYQITGKDRGLKHKPVHGQVSFTTIWPGWYSGRAIHIHVRVRKLSHRGATIAGYTTQIFFSDADNDRVLTGAAPYNTRSPQKDPTTDENDTVLTRADFATNIVNVNGQIEHGFKTTFNIALDNAEVDAKGSLGRPNTGGGPGGDRPRRRENPTPLAPFERQRHRSGRDVLEGSGHRSLQITRPGPALMPRRTPRHCRSRSCSARCGGWSDSP